LISEKNTTFVVINTLKMFRKILMLVVFATIFAGVANGQTSYRGYYNQKHVPEAEIRFSHGLLPLTYDFDLFSWSWDIAPPSLTDQYYGLQTYKGNLYSTGALSMAHSIKVAKWLEMGATLTYVGNFRNIYSTATNEIVDRESSRSLFFTPTLRFAWFNREWVRMYSSVGLGVGLMIKQPYERGGGYTEPYLEWGPSIQLTGFGISVGKRLFWFSEVQTIGTLGVFTMGVGYRVVPDKRRWQR
jgi:hypothetical protein